MKPLLTPDPARPSREARLTSGCAVALAGILACGGVAPSIEVNSTGTEVRAIRLASVVLTGPAAGLINGLPDTGFSAGDAESLGFPHVGSWPAEVPVANPSDSYAGAEALLQPLDIEQAKSVGYVYPVTKVVSLLFLPLRVLASIPGLNVVFGPILLAAAIVVGNVAASIDAQINGLIDKLGWRGVASAATQPAVGIVQNDAETPEPSPPTGAVVVAATNGPNGTATEKGDLRSPATSRSARDRTPPAVSVMETVEAKDPSTKGDINLSDSSSGFVAEDIGSVNDSHLAAGSTDMTESENERRHASNRSISEDAPAVRRSGGIRASVPSRDRRAAGSTRAAHDSDSE